jgi:choline-sulfatase
VAAVALGLGAAAAWTALGPGPRQPYNVVLIVVDTLRADHLGAWGYSRPTSPNLDRLAASGRRYARATSQAAWTTASIGSLMTSKYPSTIGLDKERVAMPRDVTTLAETLREEGLRTGAVVSHSFCSDEYNFDQGFESFDDTNVLGHVGVSSPGVTERALAFVDEHQQEPFFLWVHYFDPHFAYTLHEGHDFAPESTYAGPVRDEMRYSQLNDLELEPRDVEELHRLYDSEISWTDHHVGLLLDHLEALGLADRTMVVFTADHGEEFLDHGRLGHAKTLYEEMVRVPLIVRCPRWSPGVIDTPVANLDIFPTVLACLGVRVPWGLEGAPLGPRAPKPRTLFTQVAKGRGTLAAVQGDHKLIRLKPGDYRLFDLAADPLEQHDLAPAGGPLFESLRAEVEGFADVLRDGARKGAKVKVDARQADELEALGYVE